MVTLQYVNWYKEDREIETDKRERESWCTKEEEGEGEKRRQREVQLLDVSLEQGRGAEKRGNSSVVTMCRIRQKLMLAFDMMLKLLSFLSVGNS